MRASAGSSSSLGDATGCLAHRKIFIATAVAWTPFEQNGEPLRFF
jgi:hypothetical protein